LVLQERFSTAPESFSDDELLTRAVPSWVSEQMDIKPAWVRALQREPRLWLRARLGKGKELAERLGNSWIPEKPVLAEAVQYRGHEDLFRTPEFHAGEFEVQDISSQIVGLACAPKPGETWWDACAGEGGKMLHLSDLMQNKGMIWASDRAQWRLKRLKRRAARAGVFNYRSTAWDGGPKPPIRTKFDGVLVDAPCSCIGTWQRDPHARWTTSMNDVIELSGIQRKLLAHVAPSVKPGGKLILSVCTLSKAETTETMAMFNASQGDFEPLVFPDIRLNQRTVCGASSVTIWPSDLDGNGMFVAGWRRKKG
jgi:16S rRNA (cytosine967-C5)-methyltransferase